MSDLHQSHSCSDTRKTCGFALQIEFPVAIVDKNIDKKEPQARVVAEAFVNYLFTPEAQQEFMDCGFRWAKRINIFMRISLPKMG